ncbi:30S ribosomal protein S4 [Patescibacteria group bacterium]
MENSKSKCKKCRRAGQKLFIKGERCFSQKCAVIRKPYVPGIKSKSRRRQISEYGQQLAEKQKVRHSYGVSEKQFKNYFNDISSQKGNKGEHLLSMLERRLDNVVFRLGWACSRRLSRQLISHGHILVNNRKVNIPSYQVRKDDLIQIKEKSKAISHFENVKAFIKKYEVPVWLSLDKNNLDGKVIDYPKIDDIGQVGEINMIIEYYSR